MYTMITGATAGGARVQTGAEGRTASRTATKTTRRLTTCNRAKGIEAETVGE